MPDVNLNSPTAQVLNIIPMIRRPFGAMLVGDKLTAVIMPPQKPQPKPESRPRPKLKKQEAGDISTLHCSADWHFSRIKGRGARYAAMIHARAISISTSGIFSASIPTLAAYFDADEKTIRATLRQLVNLGFLEVDEKERGATVRYRPVKHEDWKASHPGCCVEKEVMPWSNETGDPLGRMLHQISGRQFRNTGCDDAEIVEHFRGLREAHEACRKGVG
jgi:hypothetical protein